MSKFKTSSKWRADAPRRANTGSSIRGKISAPIPFTDDDEFPIRSPGTGIATPLGTEGIEKQLQLRGSLVPSTETATPPERTTPVILEEPDTVEKSQTPPMPAHEPPAPPPAQSQPIALQTSATSMPSAYSDGKPQRKKSSLRSVLGRLFGKKSRNAASPGMRSEDQGGLRAGQHRSDPTALNRNPKDAVLSQQRSTSLPIDEINRALRSHSTATDDFPSTEVAGLNGESATGTSGKGRPRRATTPSRLWTPNRTPGYADWTGLTPRPVSSQARGSHVVEEDSDAPIGVAVTSGSHPNRRSRSLGELREAMTEAPFKLVERRRSDEIRYWRESYDPGVLSPMSSNKAEAEEPIVLDEPEYSRDDQPAPQPFNFGPMGEMAGMKITQAASLETRVQRLEKRMHGIERVVVLTRKQHNSGDPLVFQDPPRKSSKRRSRSENRPGTGNSELALPEQETYRGIQQVHHSHTRTAQIRSSSYGSSRPSTTTTQNSHYPSFENTSHSFLSSLDHADLSSSHATARPLSTSTTIRGMPSSSPTLPKDVLTHEHYTTLANMIIAEQSARHHLETVVRTLQLQVQKLRSQAQPASTDETPTGDGEFSSFEQDSDEGGYSQDFQTPNEDRAAFGDEIFGPVPNTEIKSPPRTMSLSQMTLGNGMQPSLNF